jgi:hypothetical protein
MKGFVAVGVLVAALAAAPATASAAPGFAGQLITAQT